MLTAYIVYDLEACSKVFLHNFKFKKNADGGVM